MKNTLIRLTSTDNKGNFDCDFQDDIIIKENTEIALHSLSVERQMKSIVLDATNSVVRFQISAPAGVKQVSLEHGTLNRENFDDNLRDLTDKMNSALRFFRGTPQEILDGDNPNTKETGTQIKISINANKNVFFDFRYAECFTLLSANVADNILSTTTMNTASNQFKSTETAPATSITDLQKCNLAFKAPISLGTHISRCRIRDFVNADGDTSGLIMGITDDYNKIVSNSLTLDDLNFAMRVKQNGSVIEVKNGKTNPFGDNGGGTTLTNFTPNSANNDVLAFEIREDVEGEGQKLLMRKYTTGADGGTTLLKVPIELRTASHNDIPYYFVIALLGGVNSIKIDHVGSCRNAYFTSQTESKENGELGLPSSLPSTSNQPSDYALTLPSTLADYFGFDNPSPTIIGGSLASFTGNRQFEELVGSDNYIIEMLNMNINTYDSLAKGRKNILAYVPVSETIVDDKTGIVQYEPKERLFLPLANEYAETLRNIRARVITSDFSTIGTEGLSSLNIILRS